MPSPLKKWMCPNHVEHDMVCNSSTGRVCLAYTATQPKRRTPKTQKIVGVTRRGTIEVIPSAEDMALEQDRRFEEVWINSKKYMIPERSVRLDFLDRVHSLRRTNDTDTSALRYGFGIQVHAHYVPNPRPSLTGPQYSGILETIPHAQHRP
jgi:hypothetical protein